MHDALQYTTKAYLLQFPGTTESLEPTALMLLPWFVGVSFPFPPPPPCPLHQRHSRHHFCCPRPVAFVSLCTTTRSQAHRNTTNWAIDECGRCLPLQKSPLNVLLPMLANNIDRNLANIQGRKKEQRNKKTGEYHCPRFVPTPTPRTQQHAHWIAGIQLIQQLHQFQTGPTTTTSGGHHCMIIQGMKKVLIGFQQAMVLPVPTSVVIHACRACCTKHTQHTIKKQQRKI